MAKKPSSRASKNAGAESTVEFSTEYSPTETIMESTAQTEPHDSEVSKSTALTSVAVAVEGLKEGASQARRAAGELLPNVGRACSKVVYTGFYGVSYGVVFSGLLIGSLIPKSSAVAKGVCDGADSATKAFAKRREEKAAIAPADEGLAAT